MNEPKKCLTDGSPVTPDHKEINPSTGQQADYVVLCPEDRAKGFVRPLRRSYRHVGRKLKHALRELTESERKLFSQYAAFEIYPEGGGRYWTQKQLDGGCGAVTTMSVEIAETYARDPKFYGWTFCIGCRDHLRVDEFRWEGTEEVVGS